MPAGCSSRPLTQRSARQVRCAPFTPGSRTAEGSQVALCAPARKLAVLCWHLLTRGEDYRHAAPTVTQRKLRKPQRQADDPGPRISLAGEVSRKVLERRLLEQAERNYRTHVAERAKTGAGATTGDTTH